VLTRAASTPRTSSNAVVPYHRVSIASSLPGAHSRLIASTAAIRDQGTSAGTSSSAVSQKRSSPKRCQRCQPSQTSPKSRGRVQRMRSRRISTTGVSAVPGAAPAGKSASCCSSPCALKMRTVFRQRASAALFSSPRQQMGAGVARRRCGPSRRETSRGGPSHPCGADSLGQTSRVDDTLAHATTRCQERRSTLHRPSRTGAQQRPALPRRDRPRSAFKAGRRA